MPPPSLRELQGLFWRSIALRPGAGAHEPALLSVIETNRGLAPAARLGIYESMYLARLVEVLREDFPRVADRIGAAAFADRVAAYLARHPSCHPSVRHLGERFAAFLAEAGDTPPFLPDLARLEWARVEAFDAPDAEPVTLEELRSIRPDDWPRLKFAPVPACTIVHAAWPIHRIWAGEPANGPAATVLRVWRQGFAVYHAPMDTDEQDAFTHVQRGETFAVICEVFAALEPEDAAQRAASLLARWVEDGVVVRITGPLVPGHSRG